MMGKTPKFPAMIILIEPAVPSPAQGVDSYQDAPPPPRKLSPDKSGRAGTPNNFRGGQLRSDMTPPMTTSHRSPDNFSAGTTSCGGGSMSGPRGNCGGVGAE